MISSKIHDIWRRELALDDFSDTDDFFALGGHSLIMAKIQEDISNELGVEVPMDELFRKATVAELSAHIEESMATA
jgi:acyl carrier protein